MNDSIPLEEYQVILCTVKAVSKTNVIVNIEDLGIDGNIPVSEVAPGRIRNLRDYVVPNKKIVCKVLRVDPSGTVVLSLRRVSQKERKEVMDAYSKENTALSVLRVVIPDHSIALDLSKRICSSESLKLHEFFLKARDSPVILDKYFSKSDSVKLSKILLEKKERDKELKKEFSLSTSDHSGVLLIQEALGGCDSGDSCSVSYLGGGKYVIKTSAKDLKTADNLLSSHIQSIEKFSKSKGMSFVVKEK
ncbi:hypothetical protein COU61_03150 [Candidatus Pacearchaeota archaeon CG10_big_fil_rev_8_21_14_0_10_35_13]|nr:MAG: hypothetical protein COU61_03150 [Candidatus Pacearchaeota archaeon CG10_big_fil_rev_8_21_14_0_10_35_13]